MAPDRLTAALADRYRSDLGASHVVDFTLSLESVLWRFRPANAKDSE